MLAQLSALALFIAIFAVPLLAMWWMWGRMRRVTAHTAEARRRSMAEAPDFDRLDPAYDELDPATGEYRTRRPTVNEELIRQGAKASQPGWVYDP